MWTLQDAKNKFSAVVDAAMAGVPQKVTRRGKPAVVVMDAEEYARVVAGKPRNLLERLMSFPKGGPEDDAELV